MFKFTDSLGMYHTLMCSNKVIFICIATLWFLAFNSDYYSFNFFLQHPSILECYSLLSLES
jgi:hypothetical protein